MFNPIDWFKSSKDETEAPRCQERTWDPNTMTMNQPTSPNAPTTERVVTRQPSPQEQMQLRGGGEGGFCCGICAGCAALACCEICC